MKLYAYTQLFIALSIIFISYIHSGKLTSKINESFQTQSRMALMMKFKEKNNMMLDKLFLRANRMTTQKIKTHFKKSQLLSKYQNQVEHVSSINNDVIHRFNDGREYTQYRYKNYGEIVNSLYDMAKKHPDYLKVFTAQELYDLPYPGGYCDSQKKQRCEHHIAFLTNHNIDNISKSQILISGEVHGNERVGPTAVIELIELILEKKDNPWIKFILEKRYIVLIPMTNPHGYYDKIREELLIKDEDIVPLFKKMYDQTHKDINRDFPMLVKQSSCMETIGARVVNELYINHLFSVALSLHGGTESLTYPYGTPNHIISEQSKKIPMNYKIVNGRLISEPGMSSDKIVEQYRNGKYNSVSGRSTHPPDYYALQSIATTASHQTTSNKNYRYKTGDMNGEVYPVTGGMEDWAYSGSWEGSPIITQPCTPKTYGGYSPEKTMYDKYYPDALKSIMFLLEASHAKTPEQKFLGLKNFDCILNLRDNAFFNNVSHNSSMCLDGYIDGYIPRIIRLSLVLIDILTPYVTYTTEKRDNSLQVIWTVGGAITVDSTFIMYDYFNEIPSQDTIDKIDSLKSVDEHDNVLNKITPNKSGKAVWHLQYSSKEHFSHEFQNPQENGKYLIFVIFAKVDQSWGRGNTPDPNLHPQTHIANARTNDNYRAQNGKFKIEGSTLFKTKVAVISTSNLDKI